MTEKKKIKVIAHPESKKAIERLFKRLFKEDFLTDSEEEANGIILDLSWGDSYQSSKYSLHAGLQHLYRFVIAKSKPVFLLTGLSCTLVDNLIGKGLSEELKKICKVKVIQEIGLIKELKNWIDSLPRATEELKSLEEPKLLIEFLQKISHEQFHIGRTYQPGTSGKSNPWNVLVIDNDLLEGDDEHSSLHRVLGFPDKKFYERINPIAFRPSDLMKEYPDVPAFLTNLRYALYENDIDLISLDLSLGYEIKNEQNTSKVDKDDEGKTNFRNKRFGFNFIDLINQQCLQLGWQPIPIVTFTAYDKDTSLVVESILRGSKWFATKRESEIEREFEAKKERTAGSWIGHLPEIIKQIDSREWSKFEYLQKFLPTCGGETAKAIRELLEHQLKLRAENSAKIKNPPSVISESEFDFEDSFFSDAQSGQSLSLLVAACKEKNGRQINLNKFWEYHYILRQIFLNYDHITITNKSVAGFSATNVFYVLPSHEGVTYSNHIVKIGARDLIELEISAFEEWIDGLLDTFIGRIKGKPVRADIYAGLLYVSIGIKDDYNINKSKPRSLFEIIHNALEGKTFRTIEVKWEEVEEFVRFLFQNVLSCFYDQQKAKKRKVFSYLISAYLEDFPSTVSGDFCGWEKHDDAVEIRDFDQLLKERLENPNLTKLWLKDFKIYEVDRIGKKLKFTNRYHYLQKRDKHNNKYPLSVKDKERKLNQLNFRADLRFEVSFGNDQDAEKIFQDPRYVRGKRISLNIEHLRFARNDTRLRFLDGSKPSQKLFTACRTFLMKTDSARFWFKPPQSAQQSEELSEKTKDDDIEVVRLTKEKSSEKTEDEKIKVVPLPEKLLEEGKDREVKYWMFEKMFDLALQGILTTPREMTFSHIHGDLNLENILLTRSDKKLLGWFIDFARSRYGHAVFDFVKFETEIKTQLVAPYLFQLINRLVLSGINEEKAVAACLEWFINFERNGELTADLTEFLKAQLLSQIEPQIYKQILEKLRRLGELILLVRHIAAGYNFGTEYNWGILFYSISTLKFRNLEVVNDEPIQHAPLPKMLAYLSACCALRKLAESDLYILDGKPYQDVFKDALKKKKNKEFLSEAEIKKMYRAFYEDSNNKGLMIAFLESVRECGLPHPPV